jgi:hypothetical protein
MAVDVSRIQQVPIFAGLSDAQVAAIARASRNAMSIPAAT